MKCKIAILTSGHPPLDERIYYKMGMTFVKFDYKVNIICSTLKVDKADDPVPLKGFDGSRMPKKEKINSFLSLLNEFSPDVIIGCEPLTILAAHKYKKLSGKNCAVFSDITEWYPENVAFKFKGLKRILSYIPLFFFNIYASGLADALIIGEITKLRRYNFIAPFKPKKIIGYYPVLKYFNYSPPPFKGKSLVLCYAGVITLERGILTLLNAARITAEKHPGLVIELLIMGRFTYEHEKQLFLEEIKDERRVKVNFIDWSLYTEISDKIKSADICFDLRKYTFIYRNSLPIKIFEYMACGKPVIFSDIIPIRKEIRNYNFGFLVDPDDIEAIAGKISLYISQPDLLWEHSSSARSQAETRFSWECIEQDLIGFIEFVRNRK